MILIDDYQQYLKKFGINIKRKPNDKTYTYIYRNGGNNVEFNIVKSEWDTRLCETNVGRLEIVSGKMDIRDNITDFILFLKAKISISPFNFIFFRHDSYNFPLVSIFEESGFRCTDVLNIYFSPTKPGEYGDYDENFIFEFDGSFKDDIVMLAGKVFVNSRFYNDFRIPLSRIMKIYSTLIEEKLDSCRVFIRIAVKNKCLAGFIIGEIDNDFQELGYLWLIAVDEKFRGHGIGKNLFTSFLNDFGKSVKWIEIGTQCNNLAAISLYEQFCFRIQTSLFSMHWHRS